MSKSKVLQGMPWHIEYGGQKSYYRKFREKCGYYNSRTGKCRWLNYPKPCHLISACPYLREKKKASVQKAQAETKKDCFDFTGIKEIDMSSILIGGQPIPLDSECRRILEYYQTHNNQFEHPVIVIYANGKYLLQKNYPTYYVAKLLGLQTICAKIEPFNEGNETK